MTQHIILQIALFPKPVKKVEPASCSISSASISYEWCMCIQAYWINSSSKWITLHCTAVLLLWMWGLRMRDLSLCFIILYLSCSFCIFKPFQTCFHLLTAAGDSVNIRNVQQEGVLRLHFCPFFGRSLSSMVWVGLSRPVTFCRNYAYESLMGVSHNINCFGQCLPTAIYTELERDACLCAYFCMLVTCHKPSVPSPVFFCWGLQRNPSNSITNTVFTHCHSHFWAV